MPSSPIVKSEASPPARITDLLLLGEHKGELALRNKGGQRHSFSVDLV